MIILMYGGKAHVINSTSIYLQLSISFDMFSVNYSLFCKQFEDEREIMSN